MKLTKADRAQLARKRQAGVDRVVVNLRLPRWMVEQLSLITSNRTAAVEVALTKTYGLKP
jgi:hypothetical protein